MAGLDPAIHVLKIPGESRGFCLRYARQSEVLALKKGSQFGGVLRSKASVCDNIKLTMFLFCSRDSPGLNHAGLTACVTGG
jgi:hypothetical protein